LNPRNSSRGLPALGLLIVLILALAVGVGGCGSGSSSSTTTTATAPPARPATSPAAPAPRSPAESSPGSSIKEYGAAADGAGKAAVTAAAHSFFTAMATGDYARLCAGLAASNREQLAAFVKGGQGGCAAALKTLLNAAAATEARKAAGAAVTSVRIKGDSAFVLFTPKGGVPSYFVMKKEDGAWKAIGLAPATPIDPTATP
jgi:hypothetical protein